jgi:CheY-like chemotaxis protein
MMVPARHVLFVEDAVALRAPLTSLLELNGYRVGWVGNGREALEYLRRADPPGLVLLDLLLPEMDGWQFLRELRRDPALASTPVVLVSAADGVPQTASAMGAVGYLEKPVVLKELMDAIRDNCPPADPG